MDKCREDFEAYIVTRYPKRSKEVVTRRLEEIDGYQFYTFKEIEDAWVIWQHQQAKVKELQKRVDAVKGLAQTFWEKSNEKHNQGKVWESKTLGECADEILDVLEQALKGEGQ
ncbi:hypothetical protein ABI223_01975 [Acinetobacter pittii]|uniref:hypothetical protein n=1 Tax=Acinetobacter pittii TaxID=48296 RepID=UPI003266D77F